MPRVVHRSARLTVALAGFCLSACGDGDGGRACTHALPELVEGWRSSGSMLACIGSDGRMWLGDSAAEVAGQSYCRTSAGGCRFACEDPDGEAPFGGSLALRGGQLVLAVDECPEASDACQGVYTRDPGVQCP